MLNPTSLTSILKFHPDDGSSGISAIRMIQKNLYVRFIKSPFLHYFHTMLQNTAYLSLQYHKPHRVPSVPCHVKGPPQDLPPNFPPTVFPVTVIQSVLRSPMSASSFITAHTPPASFKSSMYVGPAGAR